MGRRLESDDICEVILVDSSVWIDFFNGITTPEAVYPDKASGNQSIAVCELILAEVLQSSSSDKNFATAKSILTEL